MEKYFPFVIIVALTIFLSRPASSPKCLDDILPPEKNPFSTEYPRNKWHMNTRQKNLHRIGTNKDVESRCREMMDDVAELAIDEVDELGAFLIYTDYFDGSEEALEAISNYHRDERPSVRYFALEVTCELTPFPVIYGNSPPQRKQQEDP